jgi:hypothetical protein
MDDGRKDGTHAAASFLAGEIIRKHQHCYRKGNVEIFQYSTCKSMDCAIPVSWGEWTELDRSPPELLPF